MKSTWITKVVGAFRVSKVSCAPSRLIYRSTTKALFPPRAILTLLWPGALWESESWLYNTVCCCLLLWRFARCSDSRHVPALWLVRLLRRVRAGWDRVLRYDWVRCCSAFWLDETVCCIMIGWDVLDVCGFRVCLLRMGLWLNFYKSYKVKMWGCNFWPHPLQLKDHTYLLT